MFTSFSQLHCSVIITNTAVCMAVPPIIIPPHIPCIANLQISSFYATRYHSPSEVINNLIKTKTSTDVTAFQAIGSILTGKGRTDWQVNCRHYSQSRLTEFLRN